MGSATHQDKRGYKAQQVILASTISGEDEAHGVLVMEEGQFYPQFVPASQAAATFGPTTGAAGDYLSHLLVIPGTTSPGAVSLKDGSGTDRTLFAGGASSVSNLAPFVIPVKAVSQLGAWQITTGANVTVYAFGRGT
jgi:hypothetical protein